MFKIGMELILEVNKVEKIEKYKTKIADIDNEHIYISYPISVETNRVEYLPIGNRVYANFVQQDSNSYLFETEVIGRMIKTIPVIILPYPNPDKLLRVQRREFVRVDAFLDAALDFPHSESKFTTTTIDLSGGGCGIILPRKIQLENGELGKIHLVLPMQTGKNEYLTLICKVVRIFERDQNRFASLQFLDVHDHEQQIIVRYCFDKQLEYRKKGIID